MKIVYLVARILLGVIFIVLGMNGFLGFIHAQLPPGTAGQFVMAMALSHYVWFTSGVQVICGLMLLANRYVPLAIVTLAAVLANILAYHVTMQLATIPLALLTAAIWFVVAWPIRRYFAPLLVRDATVEPRSTE